MLSDPIADMLTRIRNATRVHKETVDIPASKFKEQLAHLLVREGYVASSERVRDEGMKFDVLDGGEGIMRKEDHQFLQPIYISSLGSIADKAKEPFDEEARKNMFGQAAREMVGKK